MGNALDAWLPPRRYRVVINVYTLEGTGFFGAAELAFGGKVYHSGIEIDGAEYAFGGGTTARRATGVWSQPPRKPPFPNSQFVTSLDMGESAPVSLSELIPTVAHDPAWRRGQYNIVDKNCHHFTTEMCARLGVAAPPPWLNALATSAKSSARMIGLGGAEPYHAKPASNRRESNHAQPGTARRPKPAQTRAPTVRIAVEYEDEDEPAAAASTSVSDAAVSRVRRAMEEAQKQERESASRAAEEVERRRRAEESERLARRQMEAEEIEQRRREQRAETAARRRREAEEAERRRRDYRLEQAREREEEEQLRRRQRELQAAPAHFGNAVLRDTFLPRQAVQLTREQHELHSLICSSTEASELHTAMARLGRQGDASISVGGLISSGLLESVGALDAHDDPVVRARARELAHEWWWEDGEDSGKDG